MLDELASRREARYVRFSPDGLLAFAGLTAAKLTSVSFAAGTAMAGHTHSEWVVELTERGRLLVDAWRAGDEERWTRAVGGADD